MMRSSHASTTRAALVLITFLVTACGGNSQAFSSRFPDNQPDAVEALLARLERAEPETTSASLAVGLTTAPVHMFAYDLQSKQVLWRVPSSARHAPIVTGKYVVAQETGGVVGRDARTGREVFVLADDGMTINGASGHGSRVVVVLTRGNGAFAESEVTLVDGGSVQWQRDLRFTAGSPALIGDVVLVPWGNQHITALDVSSGDEIARLRTNDAVVGHVLRSGTTTFGVGLQGFFALDAKLQAGSARNATYFAFADREMPGRPKPIRDPYSASAMPPVQSAEQRIRLFWRPVVAQSQATLEDATLYLVFYRFVFAMAPHAETARWVYTHETDIVGGAAVSGGLLLADDAGAFTLLSAGDGQVAWQTSSEQPSQAISFDDAATAPASTGASGEVAVREQLLRAAMDPDSRLVPARALSVELLATLDDPAATESLIHVCEDTQITGTVRVAACKALGQRTGGTEHILAALARHASFLDGTRSPPLGPLSKAAVASHASGAAALLLSHLQDPSTRTEDLPPIMTAIAALDDESVIDDLMAFVDLYHADAGEPPLVIALQAAIDFVVKKRANASIEWLTRLASDGLAEASIRQHARTALDALESAAAPAEGEQAATTTDGGEPASAEATPEQAAQPTRPAGPPARMTLPIVQQVLEPVTAQLRACLKVGERQYYSARVVLVIEDASVLTVSVVPQPTQACIEPIIRAQRFPRTIASQRERIDYTLNYR